jgi:vacuolar-type H+-ATPase subunit F/Vma7
MSEPQLVVIANPGLGTGFALSGVRVFEASNGEDAAAEIARLAEQPGGRVIIIEEPLYRDIPEDTRRGFERSPLPVVIPVPGPDWAAESTAHEYIVDILRRAIGYRVRLQ